MYGLVLADPPWQLDDQGSRIAPPYPTMATPEIAALDVASLVLPDAYLVCWILSSMLVDGLEVVTAWGFVPKSTIVWCKTTGEGLPKLGMGHHVRCSHEIAIVATRGRPHPLDRGIPSWFADVRSDHSRKPEEQYELCERLSAGPYLELFGRRPRPGWTIVGNEIEGGVHDGTEDPIAKRA